MKQASNALFNHPVLSKILSASFFQYEHHCSLNCVELRRYHPLLLLLASLCRECALKRWISTLCHVTKGAVTSPDTISLPHLKIACSYPLLLNRRFCKALQMHLSYFLLWDPSSLACLLLAGSSLFPCVLVYLNHPSYLLLLFPVFNRLRVLLADGSFIYWPWMKRRNSCSRSIPVLWIPLMCHPVTSSAKSRLFSFSPNREKSL